MADTSEHVIAEAVLRVAEREKNGIATFKRLYLEIPSLVALSADDLAGSRTRNGEPMWRQIVRNIKSHDKADGNAISEGWLVHVPRVGYRITDAGRRHIS